MLTNRTHILTAAILIALAIIVGFALSVPHTRDAGRTPMPAVSTTSSTTITLHDAYKKGVHTLTGSVTAPDACATASATAETAGTSSSSILLAIDMPADAGVCLELPTPISFSTTVTAPAGASVTATVNGASVRITPQ